MARHRAVGPFDGRHARGRGRKGPSFEVTAWTECLQPDRAVRTRREALGERREVGVRASNATSGAADLLAASDRLRDTVRGLSPAQRLVARNRLANRELFPRSTFRASVASCEPVQASASPSRPAREVALLAARRRAIGAADGPFAFQSQGQGESRHLPRLRCEPVVQAALARRARAMARL